MTTYVDTSALLKRYVDEPAVRTLDALHLGAALRLGTGITFCTFDARLAHAARSLGFVVAGA